MTERRSREALLSENAGLRIRLQEAEDTLRAISMGEVDAFVVSGEEGERIFTLKGAEQPYRILVETMSEGAAQLSSDGTILYCNAQLAAMLRIPLERLQGTPLSSYIAPDMRPSFAAMLDGRDRLCEREEVRLVAGDGEFVDALISLSSSDSSEGLGRSAVITDIGARKQSEEKIARLNRLYAVLSQTSKVIFQSLDRDSLFQSICRIAVEHGGFLLAWIGLVDEDAGVVTPMAWEGKNEGYLDNIRVSIFDEPEGLGPTGRAVREGAVCISGDGESRRGHRSSAAIAIRQGDRVIGVLTLYSDERDYFNSQFIDLLGEIGADISFALDNLIREAERARTRAALHVQTMERLKLAEELKREEQLLIVNSRQAAVGETIEYIAHQWNQPLGALSIYAQQLESEARRESAADGSVERISGKIIAVLQAMNQTIDDFRNFTRVEKKKQAFNLAETVEKTLALVYDSLASQNIRIETEVRDDPAVIGFRNEFSQALLIVINNAREALVQRKVAAPLIEIQIFREGGKAVVAISDNAGGIPEEIMDRIFDPYFTTKDAAKGTGIGLYLSKTIIETHMNGSISVRNTPEGAEFRIEA